MSTSVNTTAVHSDTSRNFSQAIAEHYQNSDVAGVYGHILYWVKRNARRHHNHHDGAYWMWDTVETFQQNFPWLSVPQIRRYIKKLEQDGFIQTTIKTVRGCLRVTWYTITGFTKKDSTVPNFQKQADNDSVNHGDDIANHGDDSVTPYTCNTQSQPTNNPPARSGRSETQSVFDLSTNLPVIQKALKDKHGNLTQTDQTWLQSKLTELVQKIGKTRLTLSWALTMVGNDYAVRMQSERRTALIGQQRDRLAAATANKLRAHAEKLEREAQTMNPRQERRQPETGEMVDRSWGDGLDLGFGEECATPVYTGGQMINAA